MVEIIDPCTCQTLSAPRATVNGVASMPLNSNSGCIMVKVRAGSHCLPLCNYYWLPRPNNTIEWIHTGRHGSLPREAVLASNGMQRNGVAKTNDHVVGKAVRHVAEQSIASDSAFPEYDGKTAPIPRRIRSIPFADEIPLNPLPIVSDTRRN